MEEEQEEKEISTSEGGNTVCEVICRGERIEWYLIVEICLPIEEDSASDASDASDAENAESNLVGHESSDEQVLLVGRRDG